MATLRGASGGYSSWRQVAGYFDGDGTIGIRKTSRGVPFTLNPVIQFTDQSKGQIEMLKRFLESHGTKTGKIWFNRAWRVEAGTIEGLLRALTFMLPFLYKKAGEAEATIKYLEGGITENQLQQILEHAVKVGDPGTPDGRARSLGVCRD